MFNFIPSFSPESEELHMRLDAIIELSKDRERDFLNKVFQNRFPGLNSLVQSKQYCAAIRFAKAMQILLVFDGEGGLSVTCRGETVESLPPPFTRKPTGSYGENVCHSIWFLK